MASPSRSQGYDALAHLMGCYSDLGIFHKFTSLNAGNLLDLQAGLLILKKQLNVLVHHDEDIAKCPEPNPFRASVYHMKGLDAQICPYHDRIQRKKHEIRHALSEYNEALSHVSFLSTRQSPPKRDLAGLRKWLRHKDGGNNFLQGLEFYTWSDEVDDDLACFGEQKRETDIISRWIAGPVLEWYHTRLRTRWHDPLSTAESQLHHDILGPLQYYPNSDIAVAVNTINTVLASLLPTVPIFILFYIQDQVSRMVAILAIAFVSSTLLVIFTNARRFEIIAASTAFTAVQIVFLTGV